MAKILIIEDEKSVQEFIKETLMMAGYEVETADDGKEGYNKAITRNYDLITIDLRMSDWDGSDCIYNLSLSYNKIPIVVISAYLDEDSRFELSRFPFIVGMLEKPIDKDKLLELIKENI